MPGSSPADVALVEWPRDEAIRGRLAARQRPRLLLVAPTSAPPVCIDDLEDWVRHPVDVMDLVARMATVRARAQRRAGMPVLDASGLVWRRGQWVSIPPAQLPLVSLLVTNTGRMVSAVELRDAYASAGGSIDPVALKAAVHRLARRLAPLGLRLHNLGGRGSLLEVDDDPVW